MSDTGTAEPEAVETKFRQSTSKSSNIIPFFSMFSDFQLRLPFSKQKLNPSNDDGEIVSVSNVSPVGELTAAKPVSVTLPRTSIQSVPIDLKLTTGDESEDQSSSPLLVYALGGFLMLRWAWTKWQRRAPAADE